jgi:hypothetical protein
MTMFQYSWIIELLGLERLISIPPAEGFTRIAKEDEIVVCPNCDHELGTGDDPVKRQIWVAKPCGHVSSLTLSLFSIDQRC